VKASIGILCVLESIGLIGNVEKYCQQQTKAEGSTLSYEERGFRRLNVQQFSTYVVGMGEIQKHVQEFSGR